MTFLNIVNQKNERLGIVICVISAVLFGFYPVTAKAVYQDSGNVAAVVLIVTLFRFLGLYALSLWQKEKYSMISQT